jgi:hypothetical protein
MAGQVIRRGITVLAAGILMVSGWGCQQKAAARPATRPATTRAASAAAYALKPIEYIRSGGFAGTRDVITVEPNGDLRVEGRIAGKRSGRLTPEQQQDLAALFEGWDQLATHFPETPANDTYQYSIRYGDRTITAGQLSKVPPQFAQVRDRLETLAQSLPDQATR